MYEIQANVQDKSADIIKNGPILGIARLMFLFSCGIKTSLLT